jgi:hypothetical protein
MMGSDLDSEGLDSIPFNSLKMIANNEEENKMRRAQRTNKAPLEKVCNHITQSSLMKVGSTYHHCARTYEGLRARLGRFRLA